MIGLSVLVVIGVVAGLIFLSLDQGEICEICGMKNCKMDHSSAGNNSSQNAYVEHMNMTDKNTSMKT